MLLIARELQIKSNLAPCVHKTITKPRQISKQIRATDSFSQIGKPPRIKMIRQVLRHKRAILLWKDLACQNDNRSSQAV